MNLYIRYFAHETLAHDLAEALAFIEGIGEFNVNDSFSERITNFIDSTSTYPMRLKVSYSNYILFLKTDATTIEEFHELEEKLKEANEENKQTIAEKKRLMMEALNEKHEGWYETNVMFKRVVIAPETLKCQYIDTSFAARLKAESAMDAYNRTIEHLQNRDDIDQRSQFPSVRSDSFSYKYLGETID